MILADTNFWLALTLSKHVFHGAARHWLAGRRAEASVLFCRSTQQSFLRLLTTEGVTRPYGLPPLKNASAWEVYQGLISDGRIAWAPEPQGEAVEARWKSLAARGSASPKLWMDAYLAAFAMAGKYRLLTTDRAFRQFEGLDLIVLGAGKAKA